MTASIARGFIIARDIKEIFPDARIVFGDIHPTILPEDTIRSRFVDFVCGKRVNPNGAAI